MRIETSLQLLKRRRTKIVATLGPSSSDPVMIEKLIRAGVNVFRLNFSHGEHDWHRAAYLNVRLLAAQLGEPISVLADLCGPKIRAGQFEGGSIELRAGERVTVTTRDVKGGPGLIPSQYEALARDVRAGNRILLDDGKMELRVESTDGTEIACVVVQGGVLRDRKGMNLPNVKVSAPSLTEKDREDAQFALELGVDFLALSFVRRAADVRQLRGLVVREGSSTALVAKIEKPEALEDIDAILEAADAIMIARGDLGVEVAPQLVPVLQDQLVVLARSRYKPVIVATQMLESMIQSSRPTRAEVADVSHAVTSGADAVMLSAETAAGAFPVEAVQMMDAVARQAEGLLWRQGAFGSIGPAGDPGAGLALEAAVCSATAQLSRDLKVRSIQVITVSGRTARMVCGARPAAPILAVSADPRTCRRMNLLWGAIPIEALAAELEDRNALARRVVQHLGLASSGDYILLVRGFHQEAESNAPTITVLVV